MERGMLRRSVVLAVLAMIATACGNSGGTVSDAGARSTTSTTSTTKPTGRVTSRSAGTAATTAPSGSGGTGAAVGTTTTVAPSPGGTTHDQAASGTTPAAASPIPPGTYRYDTEGSSTISGAINRTDEMPKVTTLEADAPDGTRQHTRRDLRDNNGNGSVTDTVFDYREDGVYLVDLKITVGASGSTFSYEFRPSPPPMVAPTGAQPGTHLAFSIDSTDGGIHADVTIDVLRRETVRVGDTDVNTLLVHTHTRYSGTVTGEGTTDQNLTPDRTLPVREHAVNDAQVGVTKSHSEYTALLQSLRAS